eukprot:TRINITY_DN5195_c0_g1_i4.p1 TRINITY_DN5195_c0_g1~~TRINITY_DN5195_c0_g1_i4.p1  ORF type:complete len:157 (-),score=40.29 TRINITY_DN5195_c0_g1_i4:482-952(-)
MIRRPPRSTHCISSAASDVYKRQYQRRVHGKENIINSFKQDAIISLSTTALVLPADELNQLIVVLQDIYHISCKVEAKYMYFVVCENIFEDEFVFDNIQIKISLDDTDLYIDPHYLIQNCTSNKQLMKKMYTEFAAILQQYNNFGRNCYKEYVYNI